MRNYSRYSAGVSLSDGSSCIGCVVLRLRPTAVTVV